FRIRQISRSFLLQSCGRGWNTDRGRCTPSVRNESNPVEDATMTVNWMEGIWKLDESCTSNPRSEILDWTGHPRPPAVHFPISAFGFEVQDASNFKFRQTINVNEHCK